MTRLTKKQKEMLESYKRSNWYTLHDCYDTYSAEKQRVYDRIARDCWKCNGWGIKIPSYNCMIFTMAYCYVDTDANIHLVYHTPSKKHDFVVA